MRTNVYVNISVVKSRYTQITVILCACIQRRRIVTYLSHTGCNTCVVVLWDVGSAYYLLERYIPHSHARSLCMHVSLYVFIAFYTWEDISNHILV